MKKNFVCSEVRAIRRASRLTVLLFVQQVDPHRAFVGKDY
jgi:hypothetical protein